MAAIVQERVLIGRSALTDAGLALRLFVRLLDRVVML
jgi:hypothetical protein